MPSSSEPTRSAINKSDHEVRAITVDRQTYLVSLLVSHDGVEYLGRLQFTHAPSQLTYQDHGIIPGSTVEDVLQKAKNFSATELERRCHRALSEKRRFSRLRRATDQMIDKIRHLNRVAIGLEKGMIDPTEGKQELDQVQSELLAIVRTLRQHAGVEDELG